MGLGVQPLEEPLAQALRWVATCQLISSFLALLGSALVRIALRGGLLALFLAFGGKEKHCSPHHC